MSSLAQTQIFEDKEVLSGAAAAFIVKAAKAAISERGRFIVALSGGGTPEPVYRLLAGPAYRDGLDWAAVYFLWGDERCVPPGDPGSNYGQAERLLLDPLAISASQVHRIKGELAPEEAAEDYRLQLAEMAGAGFDWPVIDLALMGLGADGHTASLFPGPPVAGEERLAAVAVTADYDGRPAQRVSLTPPVFNSAREVLFLVTGGSKAAAVAGVLGPEPDTARWPAARIRPVSGRLHFFLDRSAAGQLP